MPEFLQVSTTTATREEAERLAEALVEERLAGCGQVHGPLHSVFRWQERLDHATEWCCQLKTTRERLPELVARIRALHSYEVPEVIAVPLTGGSPEYLAWLEGAVRPGG